MLKTVVGYWGGIDLASCMHRGVQEFQFACNVQNRNLPKNEIENNSLGEELDAPNNDIAPEPRTMVLWTLLVMLASAPNCTLDEARAAFNAQGWEGIGEVDSDVLQQSLRSADRFQVLRDLVGLTGLSEAEIMPRLKRQGRFHYAAEHAFWKPGSSTELAWFYRYGHMHGTQAQQAAQSHPTHVCLVPPCEQFLGRLPVWARLARR